MQRAAQSEKSNEQQPTTTPGTRRSAARSFVPRSALGQLAENINSSPRVQRLAQLRDDIQDSSRVQRLVHQDHAIQRNAPARFAGPPTAEWIGARGGLAPLPETAGSNGVAQRLRAGEDLPSRNAEVAAHFANKTHNQGDSAEFLRGKAGVEIKSTLSPGQKSALSDALKETAIYKSLTGAKNSALLWTLLSQETGEGKQIGGGGGPEATVTQEHVEKYMKNQALPAQVQRYLEGRDRLLSKRTASRVSRWRDNNTLVDTAELAEDDAEAGGYLAMGDDGGDVYKENLQKAQEIISTIVQPSVLVTVPAPHVIVHRQLEGEPGFRAYQGGADVHIASEDPPKDIVHEVGHYLESNLASDLHFDAATLREKRHSEAIGLNPIGRRAAGAIADEEGENRADRKGRYKGTYGATGAYTSKVYEETGATEVVSMSMEFLSTSAKATQLVENDPQQALLVLRRLRPDDVQIASLAGEYRDFLPNAQ